MNRKTATSERPKVAFDQSIRWMIRRDMPDVLAIEESSFGVPWTEDEFIASLRQRNCIGMVFDDDNGPIKAFIVYELYKTNLHILNLAVHLDHRQSGIGTRMLDKLKGKLSQQRRQTITALVSERNRVAQEFLKSQGFIATGIQREPFGIWCDDDGYDFQWTLPE